MTSRALFRTITCYLPESATASSRRHSTDETRVLIRTVSIARSLRPAPSFRLDPLEDLRRAVRLHQIRSTSLTDPIAARPQSSNAHPKVP